MRKSLFFAGLAAAATLSFVGCNKEADLAGNGTPFEIVLNTLDTRTVNDGMDTKWKENDALSVFYAPAGSTDWSENTKFTVTDTEAGLAKGEVSLTAESNDWYLFYPYTLQIPNPKSLAADGSRVGYVYIGSGSNSSQKQTGLNSTAHLAGGDLPMFGVQKGVAISEKPNVSMKHLTTVARVNVTNATTAPITITAVSFTAPENVVGTYYIDFSGTEPVITDSDNTHVGKTARLEVKDAEALAPGATASFYIAMKPFSAPAGSTLKVQVYAGAEVSESELSLTNAVDFKANHIKKLNVEYSPAAVTGQTLAEALELADGTDVTLAPLTVGAVSTKGYVVTDGTDGLYVFVNGKPSVKVGDQVKVTGKMASYYGVRQVSGPSQTVVTEGDGIFDARWTDITASFESYTNTSSAPVKYEATVVKSGTYTNFKVEGADTFVGTLTNAPSTMFDGINEGDQVRVYGYFSTINQNNKLVGVYAYNLEVISAGVSFNVELPGADESLSLTVPATTTSKTINVTGNVAWTASASDGATVAPASGEGAGTVTVTFPANTDPAQKEYTVTVSTDDAAIIAAGLNDEFVFNITQEAASGVTIYWDSYSDWGLSLDDKGNVVSKDPISLTCGDYLLTISKKNGTTNPFVHPTDNDARAYAKATVTVKNTKNVNMTELVFKLSAQGMKRLASITADSGTVAAQQQGDKTVTWTGEATEVVFTVGDKAVYGSDGDTKAGQLCFNSINVEEGGAGVAKTLVSIAVTGQKTTFNVGESFTHDTAVVTATYSDNTSKNVTSSATFSSPDMSTAGTKTVTVSYAEGGVTKTTGYEITVNASISPTHAGTLDDPYTVADAIATTEALGEGKTASDFSYTKGIVSKIDEISTDHGNATYYISDDGTTAGQFYVFRGKYIGKTNFTDVSQLQEGDVVVVCGKLKYYKPQEGDSVMELSDNYIHSLKRNGSEAYAFNASVSSTSVSSAGASVKVNIFGNVDWTTAATGGATLEKSSGNGYSSFNVTIPANETTSEKTYTVTVSTTAAVSNNSITMTITQEAKGDGNQYVLDLTTATYSSASEDQVVWDTPVMTITVNKAGASTNANNYLGGDANNRTSSRFYKDSKVTFAPKSGVTVTSMACMATSVNYATAFAGSTWSNAAAKANDTVVTVTPTDGANAMNASIGAACGFTQIIINY